jgi:hypothetical protein
VASACSAETIAAAAPEATASGRALRSTMCSTGAATAEEEEEDMAAMRVRRAEEGGAMRRRVGRWRGDEKALRLIMVGLV